MISERLIYYRRCFETAPLLFTDKVRVPRDLQKAKLKQLLFARNEIETHVVVYFDQKRSNDAKPPPNSYFSSHIHSTVVSDEI